MFLRVKHFLRRMFQPISSSQYFTGIRLFNKGQYLEASNALELISKGEYRTSVLYNKLAQFYYHRALRNSALTAFYFEDFSQCIRQCKKALNVYSLDPVCRNYLAHAYHRVGQNGPAIQQLKILEEIEPERSDVRFNRAKILIKADKMDDALRIMSSLVDRYYNYADFHMVRGIAYARMGDSEKAVKSYKRALEINPEFGKCIMLLGLEQIRMTHYKLANFTFRQGVQGCPGDTELLFYYGITSSIINRLEKYFEGSIDLVEPISHSDMDEQLLRDISYLDYRAVEERNKLLDLDISYGEHFTFLDPVYDKPCLRNLIKVFEDLIDSFPRYADFYFKLATFNRKIGDIEKAEKNLLKALDINPTYSDALENLTALYESEDRYEEALGLISSLTEVENVKPANLIAKGRLLLKLKRYEEAVEAMTSADMEDERFHYQVYLLGHILADIEEYEFAEKAWESIRKYMPRVDKDLKRLNRIRKKKTT